MRKKKMKRWRQRRRMIGDIYKEVSVKGVGVNAIVVVAGRKLLVMEIYAYRPK